MYCQISKREKSNIMQRHLHGNTVIGTPIKGVRSLGRQPHFVTRSTSTKPQLTGKMDPWMGLLTLRMSNALSCLLTTKNNLNITQDFGNTIKRMAVSSGFRRPCAIGSRYETKSRGIFIPQMITGNKEPQQKRETKVTFYMYIQYYGLK